MENFSTTQKSQHPTNQQIKNFSGKLSNQTTLHKIFFLTHPITTPSPIHLLIHNIYQTYIIYNDNLPKNNAIRDGRLWQMFQATHKQASAIPSNPPLSPPAIQQESTKPQFFLKYYQSNHLKNYQQLFLK